MNGFIVLHNNAYLQVAHTAQDILFPMHWMVLDHPPYNPDLSSSAFHVSGPLKKPLRGFQMKTQNSTLMGTTFNCLYSNAQNNPQTDFI
jgi:hypothetical protein